MTIFNPERTYGVELEVVTTRQARTLASAINTEFNLRGINASCQVGENNGSSYGHTASSNWKIVTDVTIRPRGWEVVSPILKGFDGKAQIEAVTTALTSLECTVNTSVGMHVHHDARRLTAKQFGAVFGTYAAFQTLLNYGVAQSRRGREYGGYNSVCDWASMTDNGTKNYDRFPFDVDGDQQFSGPRQGGNFINSVQRHMNVRRENSISIGTSLSRHGTIEFRQHQGTINATKIWTWVLITQSIIERQVQKRVTFMKPLAVEMSAGKMHAKGDFYRFKNFIGVTSDHNEVPSGSTWTANRDSEPYMWAFKQLYKNIKKFSRQDGVADVKDIARN